ncbi:MAG TPA: LPS assembly lipoprotein LptE [Oleiagrimonas sp.]|nr:LPS assembly lipoprotein LptE [Oleiagrimonas sp.]
MKSIGYLGLAAAMALLLSGCGFHLRQSAQLPAGMQKVHLTVHGSDDFRRALGRALVTAGTTLVDEPGPGVAEFQVPVARFRSDALTITGRGRISEYAVRFNVRFDVVDSQGRTIVASQDIRMSREFTYDAREAIGRQTQVRAMQKGLIQNMVRSVMFRLQAVGERPASATSGARAVDSGAGAGAA